MDFVTSKGGRLPHEELVVYNDTVNPITRNSGRIYEACTHIGLRPTQEDRFVLIPSFFSESATFAGVFDGTVGPDASDFIMRNITKYLCEAEDTNDIINIIEQNPADRVVSHEKIAKKINSAMRSAFLDADRALIHMCSEKQLHYASSTGVAAFLWDNLLTIAHIGDSKACIAKVKGDILQPEWLTIDHKPNMPHELKRIEENGGSLAWLHGNKPYIRGGDFFPRQARNEHPKQLNYSRAFGGKDLKMYGLSAEPDVNHFDISTEDKLVLIGSDGLWDVLNPKVACKIALDARREGRSASADIVQKGKLFLIKINYLFPSFTILNLNLSLFLAIHEMPICGVRDNITVIALFLND